MSGATLFWQSTFRVEPLGPNNRCRRLTKRSLFRIILPILMISHATPSSKIFTACRMSQFSAIKSRIGLNNSGLAHTWGNGTLLAKSLIKSLALRIMYGSNVFFVVLTVILPSTKSKTHPTPYKTNMSVPRIGPDQSLSKGHTYDFL